MLKSQPSDNMEALLQQRRQLKEKIDAMERRQRVLKEQQAEDENMEGQLEIEKLTDSRQTTLEGLHGSVGANETGGGVRTPGGQPIFLQVGEEETARRDDPEDLGEVYPILTSNAERVEKQHELLQDQMEKVHITIQHTTLTIAKLKSDLKLFEVMKSAVKGEIDELDKGEHQAIKNMFDTLKSQSEAQQSALKSMTRESSKDRETERPSDESNETEAVETTTTSER